MKEIFSPPDQKRQLGWEGLSLPFPARLNFMPVVRLIGIHPTQNGMFASRGTVPAKSLGTGKIAVLPAFPSEVPWVNATAELLGFPPMAVLPLCSTGCTAKIGKRRRV